MRILLCLAVGIAWWDLRRLVEGASTFAGIARLCRFTTGCFGLSRRSWCWRMFDSRWLRGRRIFRLAFRTFLMGYGLGWGWGGRFFAGFPAFRTTCPPNLTICGTRCGVWGGEGVV